MHDETQVTRVDDNTLRVTKSVPQSQDYTRDYLVQQRADIVAQRDLYLAQRNAEIGEIDGLLTQCDRLNIVGET